MWVDSETIEDAFEEIRYPLQLDNDGNYVIEYFYGEKLGDDVSILSSIANYIEDGSYIDFEGEDGCTFRFLISNGRCNKVKIPKEKP